MRISLIFGVLILSVFFAAALPRTNVGATTQSLRVAGIVCDAAGKTVEGAEVVLTQDANAPACVNYPAARRPAANFSKRTDAAGRFSFDDVEIKGAFAVGMAHDSGFARFTEKTFPFAGEIVLSP